MGDLFAPAQLVAYVLSAITLVTMWQAGNRRWWAWLLGLVNQGLWFTTIVLFGVWGLLPLTVALTFVYARNLLRWRRHERTAQRIASRGSRMPHESTRRVGDLSPPPTGPAPGGVSWVWEPCSTYTNTGQPYHCDHLRHRPPHGRDTTWEGMVMHQDPPATTHPGGWCAPEGSDPPPKAPIPDEPPWPRGGIRYRGSWGPQGGRVVQPEPETPRPEPPPPPPI